jgi:hypothetical protein
MQLWWQMLVPPHTLHALLWRLCSHICDPPHSLHWLLMRLWWLGIDDSGCSNFAFHVRIKPLPQKKKEFSLPLEKALAGISVFDNVPYEMGFLTQTPSAALALNRV